jgi:hypothetical protein
MSVLRGAGIDRIDRINKMEADKKQFIIGSVTRAIQFLS